MHNHVQSRRLFYIYTLLCTTSLCPTSVQLYRRCERALSLSCSIAVLALLSLIRAYNHYASTLEQKVFGERHRSTSRGVSRRPFAILNLSSSLVPAHREPSSFNSRVRGIFDSPNAPLFRPNSFQICCARVTLQSFLCPQTNLNNSAENHSSEHIIEKVCNYEYGCGHA